MKITKKNVYIKYIITAIMISFLAVLTMNKGGGSSRDGLKKLAELICFLKIIDCSGGGGSGSGGGLGSCGRCPAGDQCPGYCDAVQFNGGTPTEWQWKCSNNGTSCGKTVSGRCISSMCSSSSTSGFTALGYDTMLDDTVPASVNSVSPGNGSNLSHNSNITIVFNEQMDVNTTQFAGSIAGHVSGNYTWSKTNEFNDTLTIRPQGGNWPLGVRSFTVNVADQNGNQSAVNLNYYIRNWDAEYNVAAAAISSKREANSWSAPKGLIRIGDTPRFLEYHTTQWPQLHEGVIYYHEVLGTFLVYGNILSVYKNMGMHNSWLGFPVQDEIPCGTVSRCSNFVGGYIEFIPLLGTEAKNYPP